MTTSLGSPVEQLDGRFTREKLHAALIEICTAVELDYRGAELLRFVNNGVFRLAKHPVVVRIVLVPSLARRAHNAVRAANWLAEHGVPVARPLPDVPQPVHLGSHVATLWEEVPHSGPEPSGADLGKLLRQVHEVPTPPFPLMPWAPLDEVRQRLAFDAEGLPDADRDYLERWCDDLRDGLDGLRPELPPGVVHNDAHLGNLISGPAGPVLCDFDWTCVGMREWDLVPVTLGPLRFGRTDQVHRELAREYGFDVTRWDGFEVLRQIRELKMVVGVVSMLRSNPELRKEFRHRMNSIRGGDPSVVWEVY